MFIVDFPLLFLTTGGIFPIELLNEFPLAPRQPLQFIAPPKRERERLQEEKAIEAQRKQQEERAEEDKMQQELGQHLANRQDGK